MPNTSQCGGHSTKNGCCLALLVYIHAANDLLLYSAQSEEGLGSLLFAVAPNFAGLARPGSPAHEKWTSHEFISDAPDFIGRFYLLSLLVVSHKHTSHATTNLPAGQSTGAGGDPQLLGSPNAIILAIFPVSISLPTSPV